MILLATLNILFFVAHTALIVFNVVGWLFAKTRKWNLALLLATLFSWVITGLWKGLGYCICTDLHWKVRAAMGLKTQADSFLTLLTQTLIGWTPPSILVTWVAGAVFTVSLIGSAGLNWRDHRLGNRN